MFNFFKKIFVKSELSREAFEAYFNRMPEKIEVKWKRDGKIIIGRVKTDEYEFVTQGVDGNDFIEMVNDSLVSVYDIPQDYINLIKNSHAYKPKKEEMEKLKRKDILHSNLSFKKDEKILQFA